MNKFAITLSLASLSLLLGSCSFTNKTSSTPSESKTSSIVESSSKEESSKEQSSKTSSSSEEKSSERKTINVTGVSLTTTSATLEEGKTKQLYATVSPYNADNRKISWTSSNKSAATVTNDGLVTAVKKGEAVITVKTEDGGFTASCTIKVVEQEKFSYAIGDTTVEIITKKTTYSSSNYIRIFTPVTNNGNVNIYLSSCSYDVYSSTDAVVTSISTYSVDRTPGILMPGETGYYTVFKTYEEEVKEGLKVEPHITIKNAKNYDANRYDVSNVSFFVDDMFGLSARGKMTNNTKEKGSTLDSVDVVLFDKAGKYLDTLSTLAPASLEPGESAVFEANSLYATRDANIVESNIGKYVVYAYFYEIVITL
ncbi:MAG: Ig-like domain-containing protein [Bacilli bacterium]|nr:Ig-like domain-containing protein [Bacilli bacterium]